MLRPFTPDWAAAFGEAINNSEAYGAAARNWRWPVAFVLAPAPTLGYPEPAVVTLDLQFGHCRDVSLTREVCAETPFVLHGDYAAWKQVISGALDPIAAVAKGRLRLEGSWVTIMLHTRAARALARCAADVPTAFPDEAAMQPARPQASPVAPLQPPLSDANAPTSSMERVREGTKYIDLYRKAKRLAWDAEAIELERDKEDWARVSQDFAREQYAEQIHRLCSLFFHGEQSVTETLSPFLSAISRAGLGIDKEMFLTSQLFDEVRHYEFFERYVGEVLGDVHTARHLARAPQAVLIDQLDDVAARLRREEDPKALRRLLVEGVTRYMGVVEAVLARTGYRGAHDALASRGWMPGLQEGFRLIRQDEGRHVAFGLAFLREQLAVSPDFAETVEAVFDEQLGNVVATVREFDYPHPIVDLEAIQQFALDAFAQFMAALGLGDGAQADVDLEAALAD